MGFVRDKRISEMFHQVEELDKLQQKFDHTVKCSKGEFHLALIPNPFERTGFFEVARMDNGRVDSIVGKTRSHRLDNLPEIDGVLEWMESVVEGA